MYRQSTQEPLWKRKLNRGDRSVVLFFQDTTDRTYGGSPPEPLDLKTCGLLAEKLKGDQRITSLTIHAKNVPVEGWVLVFDALKCNNCLKELRLEVPSLGDDSCKRLSKLFTSNKTLQLLSINECQVGDEGCRYLKDGLIANKSLTSLSVKFSEITDIGLCMIADLMRKNRTIQVLTLTGKLVTSTGWAKLFEALQISNSLQALTLEDKRIIGRSKAIHSWYAIVDALRLNKLPSLTRLVLNARELSDADCSALRAMLLDNRSLAELDLGYQSRVTRSGFNELVTAIKSNLQINVSVDIVEFGEGELRYLSKGNLRNWLEKVKEAKAIYAVDMFLAVNRKPELITLDYIKQMLGMISTIQEFRFPFTLACWLQREKLTNSTLSDAIYQQLENMVDNCTMSSDSKKSSLLVAMYTGAFRACAYNGFLSDSQVDFLMAELMSKKVFSDSRFLAVERAVNVLTERIATVETNVNTVKDNLEQLRSAMRSKKQRDLVFSIIKIGVSLFAAGAVVDLVAGIFDYSDIISIGSKFCKCSSDQFVEYAEKGLEMVKSHMDPVVGVALKKIGYDPDAVVDAWMVATISLVSPTSWSDGHEASSRLDDGPSLQTVSTRRSPVNIDQTLSDQEQQQHLIQLVQTRNVKQITISKMSTLPSTYLPSKALLMSLPLVKLTFLANSRVDADVLGRCDSREDIVVSVMKSTESVLSKKSASDLASVAASLGINCPGSAHQNELVEMILYQLNYMPANFLYCVKWESGSFSLSAHRLEQMTSFLNKHDFDMNEVDNVITFHGLNNNHMPF